MEDMSVKRGMLIKEEHIETLKHLPNKTIDAVLGAAFRVCLNRESALAVKDSNGILHAIVQSIAVSAKKFDERETAKRKIDAERKKREREAAKEALKSRVSDGCPISSIGHPRTYADEIGQIRTKSDIHGVRTERKKERIYISPIPPKGDCEDIPPEIDVEAMIGVEQGASEQPTEDCDGGREGDATAGVALAVAERMTATHPNRSGTDSFSRSLRRYLKKNPGADPEAIAGAHERWLASGAWDEEGGRYAPQLARWLWGGDWKQEPPERPEKKPPRPVEDASVFHAGASL